MSISNEPSSSCYGIFETNKILEKNHLHCSSFCKHNWHDIWALNEFGNGYGVQSHRLSWGIMGLLIGGWCDMFDMDSTTSYKLSNSLSLSSIGLC